MPTYEYRCKDCGEHLEVVQAFVDDPLTECPNCSGTLKKVFNSVGIAFKGSGFYKNDSRSSSTSTGRAGGSSTEGGSSSSTDTSSSSSSDSTTSSSSSSGDGGSGSSSTKTETTPA
jgi:putative FmdB family regulatory protein